MLAAACTIEGRSHTCDYAPPVTYIKITNVMMRKAEII